MSKFKVGDRVAIVGGTFKASVIGIANNDLMFIKLDSGNDITAKQRNFELVERPNKYGIFLSDINVGDLIEVKGYDEEFEVRLKIKNKITVYGNGNNGYDNYFADMSKIISVSKKSPKVTEANVKDSIDGRESTIEVCEDNPNLIVIVSRISTDSQAKGFELSNNGWKHIGSQVSTIPTNLKVAMEAEFGGLYAIHGYKLENIYQKETFITKEVAKAIGALDFD